MSSPAIQFVPVTRTSAQVCDLIAWRVLRALAERVRYRYVQPRVWREGDGFRIESPCCSRNIQHDGGVIDIAWLLPPGVPHTTETGDAEGWPAAANLWRLYSRNHGQACWQLQEQADKLDDLLDVLCLDSQRVFWP